MALNAIEMGLDEWIAVPDCARQRDTAKRARVAAVKYLAAYQPIHRVVFAATINGRVFCKLDGHTRAMLWQSGKLSGPPDGKVTVNLIAVKTPEEACEVYDMIDSGKSVKQSCDIVFGACRERGIDFGSSLLRPCTFGTQMRMAATGWKGHYSAYKLVEIWADELIALDSIGMSSNYGILIGVMLLTIRRDGLEKASKFWLALDREQGQKDSRGYDAIQVLHGVINTRRAEGRTAGWENLKSVAGEAWSAYNAYFQGRRFKHDKGLAKISIDKIIEEVNGAKC